MLHVGSITIRPTYISACYNCILKVGVPLFCFIEKKLVTLNALHMHILTEYDFLVIFLQISVSNYDGIYNKYIHLSTNYFKSLVIAEKI